MMMDTRHMEKQLLTRAEQKWYEPKSGGRKKSTMTEQTVCFRNTIFLTICYMNTFFGQRVFLVCNHSKMDKK